MFSQKKPRIVHFLSNIEILLANFCLKFNIQPYSKDAISTSTQKATIQKQKIDRNKEANRNSCRREKTILSRSLTGYRTARLEMNHLQITTSVFVWHINYLVTLVYRDSTTAIFRMIFHKITVINPSASII